jgi:hypothetical protein
MNIYNSSNASVIEAKGGNGGNTLMIPDMNVNMVLVVVVVVSSYNAIGATISTNVIEGLAGKTNDKGINAINHGSINGTAGYATTFAAKDLDENLKINANCFPVLANVESLTKSICNSTK